MSEEGKRRAVALETFSRAIATMNAAMRMAAENGLRVKLVVEEVNIAGIDLSFPEVRARVDR